MGIFFARDIDNAANPNNDHVVGDAGNAPALNNRRLSEELKILTEDADVRSYFHYESSGLDETSNKFCIYGYLLPQSEPYKRGSYRVRIVLPTGFPSEPPDLHLLTYIYHPAIQEDNSKLTFCNTCCSFKWRAGFRIRDLIKQYVYMIDRRDLVYTACTHNSEARELYKRDYVAYENKVLAMVQEHSIPRSKMIHKYLSLKQ
jgi:ubiquitin-protein ligase